MSSTFKSLVFWLAIVVAAVAIYQFSNMQQTEEDFDFTKFLAKLEAGQIEEVTFAGNKITGKLTPEAEGKSFHTYAPPGADGLVEELRKKNVTVKAVDVTVSPSASMRVVWAPLAVLIGFWSFMMPQMQSGGNKALSFGKSRAKLSSSTQKKVTFKDVAGADEAKEELHEIIEFLR